MVKQCSKTAGNLYQDAISLEAHFALYFPV